MEKAGRPPLVGTREALMSVLLAAALAGCGGTPFEYHSQREIPEGPGLLTGESGALILFSDKKKAKADPPLASAQAVAGDAPGAASGEFVEFREFREFRRWKDTAKDTPEFREFQDWREWKAYRSWKEWQPK
jgi:hypothetical protein